MCLNSTVQASETGKSGGQETEDCSYPWPAWDSDEYGERMDWEALGDAKENDDDESRDENCA